jgi:sterol desaturase/sphingolipid hydroxylase (fatty acid hydroxylase superfamily)
VLLILLHDTYFYIAHRFMHLKWVFRHVHRIHHLSTNPSPWAAFSFHPLEAVIEGAFIYAATLAIPIHWLALAIFIVFSHAMNVMGHLGYEMFPRNWNRKLPWALWNSSTHHNMHHQYFHSNYGLYFNLWDLIFRTNHPRYHDTFEQLHEAKVDAAVQA